ncbi:MAG TPA: S8 family serine peptidase [Steroidobacteraceae bacterium]|nr:S8 family serine peptidase [Steroidobacteraceae bacterium]
MYTFARAIAAWLALLAGGAALAAPPSPGAASKQIVVAFTNQPQSLPSSAGSTGARYSGGGGYTVAQSAQRQARRVASDYALREVVSWPIQVLSMHCVVFEITNGRPAADVLASLAHDRRVALAQPLQEFHTLTEPAAPAAIAPLAAAPAATAAAAAAPAAPSSPPTGATAAATPSAKDAAPYNDPLYDLQTNLTTLGIARAHERTQGAGVHIALIDTAVDANHPDLHGRIAHAQSFVEAQASSGTSLRHGTAVAGVIAAVANNHIGIVGIAPLAQLEVFAGCWQLAPDSDAAACNTFTLARALAAALASGASLVNLSLAGPADPLLEALVQAGLRRGITFVGAAAGTEAPFPTAIPGVITASGTEQSPRSALLAPAQHVLTLRPGGEYDFESGSSVAAAEVTGVIALLMSASPTRLTPSAITSLLGAAEQPPPAVRAIDVNAALARLDAGAGGVVAARAAH